jgi:hypothetical protein
MLVLLPDPASKTRPGWACAAPEKRDQGRALSEAQRSEASLRGPPLFWCSAGCPKRSAGTQTAGRLSLLTFFGEAKKVSRLPGETGQPKPVKSTRYQISNSLRP